MSHRVAMLLSNAFRPDPRVLKEARSLAQAGYDLTVDSLGSRRNLCASGDRRWLHRLAGPECAFPLRSRRAPVGPVASLLAACLGDFE